MATYTVNFAQWFPYEVEADSPEEAINIAHEDFVQNMYRAVVTTDYDEVIVEDEDGKEVVHY
jgi:hypothetical protein